MDAPLDYAQDGAIVTLTLNAPDIRNAISGMDMIDALVAACERLNADMSARVAILTGAGSAFSSGGNVKKMHDGGGLGGGLPAQTRRNYKLGIQRIPLAFDRLEVPIIAAVNGPAIGAGCDLACMCDMRIAAESAKFAESFVKLGIIPGRRRRLAAAARGRLFEGLRDGLHRRHAERRGSARLRPGVQGRAGCRAAWPRRASWPSASRPTRRTRCA